MATNRPIRLIRPLASAIVALAAFATLPVSAQQPGATSLGSLPAEELKQLYLRCDAAATVALLDGESAALCSRVNEELKHRVFDGDFNRLLVWWRESKTMAPQAKATP